MYNDLILPFIQQSAEENSAPQYVQMRSVNKSVVYLDTRSQYATGSGVVNNDITDMVFSTIRGSGQAATILVKDCKRLSIGSLGIDLLIPNINIFNNTFYLRYNGIDYNVSIILGYYPTPAELIAALLAALLVATGVVWITPTVYNVNTKKFTLAASTSLPFTFYDINNSLTKAQFLLNIPIGLTTAPSMVIGPIFNFYTRYIDITSIGLTRYSKIRSASNTNNNGTQIYRIYLDSDTPTRVKGITTGSGSIFNWNREDSLTQIDIKMYDEFGNKLILEQGVNLTLPGFLLLTIILEV